MRVPAQEGLRLHELQDGLPIVYPGSEQQQCEPIALGEAGRSGLAVEDRQSRSVAEEDIFGEQLSTAARQVGQRTGQGVGECGLGQAAEKPTSGASQPVPDAFGKTSETSEHNGQYFSQPELFGQGRTSVACLVGVRNTGGWLM